MGLLNWLKLHIGKFASWRKEKKIYWKKFCKPKEDVMPVSYKCIVLNLFEENKCNCAFVEGIQKLFIL